MFIFDGRTFALRQESALARSVAELQQQGRDIAVAAVLFREDAGSRFYSAHKQMAAERVGIGYSLHEFSIADHLEVVKAEIAQLNADPAVTGIIIQKPTRSIWEQHYAGASVGEKFEDWWRSLYETVAVEKDVDGLHPLSLTAVKDGTWQEQGRVLPATTRAVLKILALPEAAEHINSDSKYVIIGRSDLVGLPLFYLFKREGKNVELLGRQEFQERLTSGQKLLDADVVITATGRNFLVAGDMIKPGVVLIDVGEPRPDIDLDSIAAKAAFVTPVPGGVGPLTVVCLLENAVELARG